MSRWNLFLSTLAATLLLGACALPNRSPVVDTQVVPSPTPGPPAAASAPIATAPEIVPHDPPDTCPVTPPPDPRFVPPEPYRPEGPFSGMYWYGSNALWTVIPGDGIWQALPENASGLTQKVFWWREGYQPSEEPQPRLTVTGKRLDGEAPEVTVSGATNATAGDIGSAMLISVEIPTSGCWEITGHYREDELSFAVWVTP